MVIRLRSAAGMVAIWAVAIAGVSATAWFAIDRAGRDITNAKLTTLVATSPVTTSTAERSPAPTSAPAHSVASPPPAVPTPTVTPGPRESPRKAETPRTSTPQTGRAGSVSVAGGQVTVRCLGTGIRLQVAQPENGWRVHVERAYEGRIVVSFRTGEEEDARQVKVTSVCHQGIPVFDISKQEDDE